MTRDRTQRDPLCPQAQAQTFECPKVFEDAKIWNSVKGSDTKRAVELKDKGIYKMDVNGSFEYVYIMTETGTSPLCLSAPRYLYERGIAA